MRVLAATIGALLISVSHPALSQGLQSERPQGALHQEDAGPPPGAVHADTVRTETRPDAAGHHDAVKSAARPEIPAETATTETAADARETEAETVLKELPEMRAVVTAEVKETEAEKGIAETEAEKLLKALPEMQPMTTAEAEETEAEKILKALPEARPVMAAEAGETEAEKILKALPEARPVMAAEAGETEAGKILKALPEARPVVAAVAGETEAEKILKALPEARPVTAAEAEKTEAEKLLAALPAPRDEDLIAPVAMEGPMQREELAAAEMPADPRWAVLKETGLGTTMELPNAVFAKADGTAHKGVGRRYRTDDGRAKVAVWTEHNTKRDTPAGYLRKNFKFPRGTADYARFTPEFAVVSGVYGHKVYYLRCNLSPKGAFHCFDLAYPVREKRSWEHVVARMSRTLRPLYY